MKIKRVLWWSAGAIPLALLVAACVAYWTSTNTCADLGATAPGNPMKAIVYCDYGSADVLKLQDVEKPSPADDEVLVRVRAAAVNPLDWHFIRGTPYAMRIQSGMRKPKVIRVGVDFAGTVEAVGKNVKRFRPGDDVFGGQTGAFADYVSVREDGGVVPKPANLTFEQASSLPIAAITALQALRDQAQVRAGQAVLINVVDDAEYCDFILPSFVRRGDMTIAVSTAGRSPALARKLRTRLEKEFGEEYAALVRLIDEVRCELKQRGITVDSETWQEALELDLLTGLVKLGQTEKAREILSRHLLKKHKEVRQV